MDFSWLSSLFPDSASLLGPSTAGLTQAELQSFGASMSGFDSLGGAVGDPSYAGTDWASYGTDPQYQAALQSLGYNPSTQTYTDPSGFSYQGTPGGGNGPNGFGGVGNFAGPASGLLSSLGLGGLGGGGLGDASLLAGLLGATGGIGSALLGSNAATSAANTQAQSAQQAMALQKGMFDQIYGNMQPFNQAGQSAIGQLGAFAGLGQSAIPGLSSALGLGTDNPLSSPLMSNVFSGIGAPPTVSPTLASGAPGVNQTIFGMPTGAPTVNPTVTGVPNLSPTVTGLPQQIQDMFKDPSQLPGYSFTLDQGEQAVKNAGSATGLGLSGATGKALAQYAEGLAGSYVPTFANLALGQQGSNLNYANTNFQQKVAGAQTGLDYLSTGFNQQQQGFTNWLQQQGLNAQYGQLSFEQQQQMYSNWLNQQSALFGQQQQGFSNWATAGGLGITQGNSLLAQNNQRYNMLAGTAGAGQGALTNIGQFGASSMNPLGAFGGATSNSLAGLLTGQGAALAGGQVGSANALTGGLSSALNGLGQGLLTPYILGSGANLLGRNAFGAGSPTNTDLGMYNQ